MDAITAVTTIARRGKLNSKKTGLLGHRLFNIFLPTLSVVGQEELDGRSVNVRNRDDVGTKAKTEMVPLDVIKDKLVKLKASRSLLNKLPE